ncbi:tsukushi [Xylocopa sonorina]|uniref:tsukushi n=1 Tax=Xylocopa sonorina TaxID=1818115 RepID=UPI00403B1913
MDYWLLVIFVFALSTVECLEVAKADVPVFRTLTTPLDPENGSKTKKADVPNMCTVCSCTDGIIDCGNRNLTNLLDNYQWPNRTIKEISFKKNLLVHVTPLPRVEVWKLSLRENQIIKIDNRAFKPLINLTELDLSQNELTGDILSPAVFEGKFSKTAYEPLAKLVVLNLSHNMIRSLHQDFFEHMPNLKTLNVSGNLFSTIDRRTTLAINSLPFLEELDLSYCSLKTLSDFSSSKYLKKLDLSGNQLTSPPIILERASNLRILYLDENPIQIINHMHPFPRMPKLKELSLCCMPHLTIVGKGAFSDMPVLEHLRVQNCPKLESIDEYALTTESSSGASLWPPIKKLDLSDNALRYLPQLFVARWDWLEELDLMNNKWSCDCDNQYLIGTIVPKYLTKLMDDSINSLTCATPPEHAGKTLLSLSNRTLRCLDLNGARPEKDATILIGMLLGLLLAIPVCLTIFVFWRRGYFFCGSQGPASFSRAFYKRAPDSGEI